MGLQTKYLKTIADNTDKLIFTYIIKNISIIQRIYLHSSRLNTIL